MVFIVDARQTLASAMRGESTKIAFSSDVALV